MKTAHLYWLLEILFDFFKGSESKLVLKGDITSFLAQIWQSCGRGCGSDFIKEKKNGE